MSNKPLLSLLEKLVELDRSLLKNHHQPKLFLARAKIAELQKSKYKT
jgi:hypothetical protein